MKTSVDKIAVYKLWIKMGKQLSQNVALPGCAVQLVLISDVLECESFFEKFCLNIKIWDYKTHIFLHLVWVILEAEMYSI